MTVNVLNTAPTLFSCFATHYAEESGHRCAQLVGQYTAQQKPPEASPASPAVAAQPKIDPETVAAYVRYASSCTCNRQHIKNPTYEASGPLTYRVDGASTPGPRTTVAIPVWEGACSSLSGQVCSRKNVKCGRSTQFTDDSGKVIAVGNDCAAKIDYW